MRVSIDNPNWKTDLNAGLHNIKLYQTRSYKPGKETAFKTLIYGEIKLQSESLVCPTLIQEQYTFEFGGGIHQKMIMVMIINIHLMDLLMELH